jgi:23S rRNA (cytidine1920-2'-O)/16S rRNA (cytidine1409-2'-O)-methyltransferase
VSLTGSGSGDSKKTSRLDLVLVERGIAPTRERAGAVIMAGSVFVDGVRVDKAGKKIKPDAEITISKRSTSYKSEAENPYVSRGGLKLDGALSSFEIDVKGKTALDVGASTGGFTDCLLGLGAKKIYALDVGYGQLAWKLRTDQRVVPIERKNIRLATKEDFDDDIDLVVIDVSFISLTKVLPVVKDLSSGGMDVIALIKPQFEAGRENIGKGGVVRDSKIHEKVIDEIKEFAHAIGFDVRGVCESPLMGPKGNREFFIHLSIKSHNG